MKKNVSNLEKKELETENRYEKLIPKTKEEFKALEQVIIDDGNIYNPIIVWKGKDIIIDGNLRWKIYQSHKKQLPYPPVKEIDFKDWQEALIWSIEHHISRKSLSLWQKLELAMTCEEYWVDKVVAQEAKGARTDLRSVTDRKLKSTQVNEIVAKKVGCGRTTVMEFKKVYDSPNYVNKCRNGEMSISAAYDRITKAGEKKSDDKKKDKSGKKTDDNPEIIMEGSNIFDECEKYIDVGRKNTKRSNGTPVNPAEVSDKIRSEKVPDGAIWVVLYKDKGTMQVVKKSKDKETGNISVKINSFNCHITSKDEGMLILEADHINGSTEELRRKDDADFNGKAA